jgi:hypothetical protein
VRIQQWNSQERQGPLFDQTRPAPNTHENSKAAYRELEESGRLGKQQKMALAVVTEHGPCTDRQVTEQLSSQEGREFEVVNVRPRITELIKMGYLEELPDPVRCPKYDKNVRLVKLKEHTE